MCPAHLRKSVLLRHYSSEMAPAGNNLTWAPPPSPLRIDFSTELLYELLRARDSGDARGLLFGMRNGKLVWILAAHRLPGAAPVGIFVARARGEVFLTESDLAYFDEQRAELALAVVGGMGGFFVREADGAIRTIQSYEEFPLPDPGPLASAPIGRRLAEAPLLWWPEGAIIEAGSRPYLRHNS